MTSWRESSGVRVGTWSWLLDGPFYAVHGGEGIECCEVLRLEWKEAVVKKAFEVLMRRWERHIAEDVGHIPVG